MDAVRTRETFTCNSISGIIRPTSRQGRFSASGETDAIQNGKDLRHRNFPGNVSAVSGDHAGDLSKISPVVSILCIMMDSLRATATAARLSRPSL